MFRVFPLDCGDYSGVSLISSPRLGARHSAIPAEALESCEQS